MAEEAKIIIELKDGGVHAEVTGTAPGIMLAAGIALSQCRKALEEHKQLSRGDTIDLMEEVIESYRVEAAFGKKAATDRAICKALSALR